MGGSSIQLFAIGPQDLVLTGNPQITFFKSVFRRYTNFSKELQQIIFSGESPTFGSTDVIAKINKQGDLLSNIYLEATVTGTTDKKGAYTVNHFGNSLIKKVEFEIGKRVIDTQYSQWLQIYDELTENISENKQTTSGLNGGRYSDLNFTTDINATEINVNNRIHGDCPLVFGGSRTENINSDVGTYTKKIIVPLHFWFTKNPGLYLPICALYNHDIELRFTFEEKYKLIGNSANINNLNINFKLYGEFITLDILEKNKFKCSNHEYIIEQIQLNNNGPYTTSPIVEREPGTQLSKVDYELNFSHPIKYFVWVIVNEGSVTTSLSNNSGQGPCYFVSQCSNSLYGNDGQDGMVEILFDGIEREQELPMMYYTRLYPKNHCKNVPDLDRIGFYSFALNPFNLEPSGTCNFSKINDRNIKIVFANNDTSNIINKPLYFFGVNYNVLLIENGMAGIKYS